MDSTSVESDNYVQHTRLGLDPQTLKRLSQIRPGRGLAQIALEWLAIAAAIVVSVRAAHPAVYVLAVFWIGARQNGLATLMHEAVHYRLLRDRTWNDRIGELLAAWPVLVTVHGFRQNHFAHHRHVNKPEDPDWVRKQNARFAYPKPAREILAITLKYLLGFYALVELTRANQAQVALPRRLRLLRLAFYVSVVVASVVFDFWLGLVMYWVVPLFTYFLWIIYVRGVAEHFAGIEHHEELLRKTRHIEANLLERLFLAPNYIHVHVAHHLYPSVPFYNLPELHDRLMQLPDYAERAHTTQGYVRFLKECLGQDRAA
ncbi:MAG: fatty acid desaturase family protein [Myxococcales bacterium]|nr:fatty acid desaturase family protein [Myxococcales bacterium]